MDKLDFLNKDIKKIVKNENKKAVKEEMIRRKKEGKKLEKGEKAYHVFLNKKEKE